MQAEVAALHQVRERLLNAMAHHCADTLRDVYARCTDCGAFSIDATAIGKRRLKNACLALLARSGDARDLDLARAQFESANNMSDEIAALQVLVNVPTLDPQEPLQTFYDKWRNERLVIDKWFSIQAMSRREDTLQRVVGLAGHDDFDVENPNRVRSLVGAFSVGNPVRFHAKDGSGYRFLADWVIRLDALNPQIAARLVGAMSRWRRHVPDNQVLMQAELQRICTTSPLSNDVYELVSKSLA